MNTLKFLSHTRFRTLCQGTKKAPIHSGTPRIAGPTGRLPRSSGLSFERLSVSPGVRTYSTGSAAVKTSTTKPPRSKTGRRILFTTLGVLAAASTGFFIIMSTTPISPFLSNEPDVEFIPSSDEQRKIEEDINNHPYVKHLRSSHPKWHESRPHLNYPSTHRAQSLTAGTLAGQDRIEVPPYMWVSEDGKELVTIAFLGKSLCGHPGVIHGGLLATLLDEGLARCAFASLPNKIGMTASLKVDYKAPTLAESYIVLKAKTDRVEGRKCWVKGHIETLNGEGKLEKGQVLVTAEALMIEPKGAGLLRLTMPHLATGNSDGQKAAEQAVEIAGAGPNGAGAAAASA
ncbi:hypothetical protein BJ508DRAFT_411838 [Ascobolus immersus RN42]|uniref:Thioesterase domain-containing protein n=1 Tax=Ascobolus immersus RN42 TaxID=1160509 RepID=A0A3N4IKB0_ASCIM|nr:hypothetical protein BJ508DRAFT_411838 [Ascobolus immersus RN42]